MSDTDIVAITHVPSLSQLLHIKIWELYGQQRTQQDDPWRERRSHEPLGDGSRHSIMRVGVKFIFLVKEMKTNNFPA
jgi:hypothetical protein